jgi:hypothetical protein
MPTRVAFDLVLFVLFSRRADDEGNALFRALEGRHN